MERDTQSTAHGKVGPPRLMGLALAAANDGHFVIPLRPRSKIPALHGEAGCPRTGSCVDGHLGWEERATREPERIRAWWARAPMNIGIATGPSGLHVLDLDDAHGQATPDLWTGTAHGRDVLARLAEEAGESYPGDTLAIGTPSAGEHLYFRAPAEPELRNTVARLGWRIDTRGAGGYIVAAGSITAAGRYRVVRDLPIAPLPQWLVPLMKSPVIPTSAVRTQPVTEQSRQAYLNTVLDTVARAEHGRRHHVLVRAAYTLGRLVAGGEYTYAAVHHGLRDAAAQLTDFPTPEAERTIADGLRNGAKSPRRFDA
ncbi:hypothetical protein [Alloactinosynnema sp. L-07]|uniref:bifunctional DNA primase/polymerase n=1 Tax=Alloactinosynnema sp. L-07 TaxID=1653480 RepID=UPI00065EFC02|nr:bifunctional DNA primase/polymerase [Alloactinosynnema sp. L-07]CRK59199.1 hypothetical protein [Alloactinosynnema sp. L-07]